MPRLLAPVPASFLPILLGWAVLAATGCATALQDPSMAGKRFFLAPVMPEALARLKSSSTVAVSTTDELTFAPVGRTPRAGLVFYPGGYVDPRAYGPAALALAGIEPEIFIELQVPDDVLIERVVGRRLDPQTGTIYHTKFFPPPPEIVSRLTVRSDDTEEKARNRLAVHARNVDAVRGMYNFSKRTLAYVYTGTSTDNLATSATAFRVMTGTLVGIDHQF